jgi:hypothetical protein
MAWEIGNKTREEFINNAFLIVEQEGVGNLTSRNLYAKTSLVQSSFHSQFKNLDNLILEINNLTLKKIQTLLNQSIEKGKRQKKTYTEIIGLTLPATCKINNINPQKYLHKLLSVIAGYNHKKIEDLLPWNLKLD